MSQSKHQQYTMTCTGTEKNSQFIICDTGNDQLDGRIGYVDWFDADHLGYRSLLCPKGSSDFGHSIPMLVKPKI